MNDPDILTRYEEYKAHCICWFLQHSISVHNIRTEALLNYEQFRNVIIRQEYHDTVLPGNTEGVREELARKYCLDIKTIEGILYNGRA